jgi:hypothetical protein
MNVDISSVYQHCCGLLSMKPTNNVQEFHGSEIAVDLAEYQREIWDR